MGNMQTLWSFIHPKDRAKIKSGSSLHDEWRTGPLGFFKSFKPRDTISVFITIQARRWGYASCSEFINSYPAYKIQSSQIPSTLTSSLLCLSILSPEKSSWHLQHLGQLLIWNEPEDAGTDTLIIAPPFHWLPPS